MDYKRIYYEIIENRKANIFSGYTETHHILPKSCGGSDDIENLVNLSAREHFVCHYLLTKIYAPKTKEFYSMIKAFHMMGCFSEKNKYRYINSRLYDINRKHMSVAMSKAQSGMNNSQYGTKWKWIHNDDTKEIRKIKQECEIPNGWDIGLTFNLNDKLLLKEQLKRDKEENKKIKKLKLVELYTNLYETYNNVGFDNMVKLSGYNKSKANFVSMCSRHVKKYVSQNGKKRGT